VRDRLAADGLTVHVKLSGSKGLHLLVGLEPTPSDQVSAYARAVAEELERERPELFTAVMAKARRSGRLFLDWSQNNAAKTTASPYTVRANTRPTVSAPMDWRELEQARDVRELELTIDQMPDRIAAGDLLADLLDPARAFRLPDTTEASPRVRARPQAKPAPGLLPPLEVVRPTKVTSVPTERSLSGGRPLRDQARRLPRPGLRPRPRPPGDAADEGGPGHRRRLPRRRQSGRHVPARRHGRRR
jgi:hypothetical protein